VPAAIHPSTVLRAPPERREAELASLVPDLHVTADVLAGP
jgi:hypothetical protein